MGFDLQLFRMPLTTRKPAPSQRVEVSALAEQLHLRDCAAGALVRIERMPSELDCAQRLRELGIVEGADVLVLRRSDPLLVLAKESRIAIDLSTAGQIEVRCE